MPVTDAARATYGRVCQLACLVMKKAARELRELDRIQCDAHYNKGGAGYAAVGTGNSDERPYCRAYFNR